MADPIGHLSGSAAPCQPARRAFLRQLAAGVAVAASVRLGVAASPGTAGSPANAASAGATTVRPGGAAPAAGGPAVRFTVFAARPLSDLGFAPRPGAAPQPLRFYPTARSARYEVRGRMPVQFVDTASGEVVAEATIPPEIREPLLLFTPAEAGAAAKLKYQVAVLDDSVAHHPIGALVILNLSGLALTGMLNDEPVTVKSGLNAPLTLARPAKLGLRTTFKGRAYPAYSGDVKLARNERGLLILFPPFYPGSLEVQARLLIDRR